MWDHLARFSTMIKRITHTSASVSSSSPSQVSRLKQTGVRAALPPSRLNPESNLVHRKMTVSKEEPSKNTSTLRNGRSVLVTRPLLPVGHGGRPGRGHFNPSEGPDGCFVLFGGCTTSTRNCPRRVSTVWTR